MVTSMEEDLHLGDKIVLSGFSDLDRSEMVVVKKVVGTYVKKFIEMDPDFQELSLHLKIVHEREQSVVFEIKGNYVSGSGNFNSNENGRNLYVILDLSLRKILDMIKKD